jgi:hypothetical protein
VVEFLPESAACLFFDARTFACNADVLAGEPAADEVWSLDLRPVDFGDVTEVRDSWPVFGEDCAGVSIDFRLPYCSESSCSFESKFNTPNATEKRADCKHIKSLFQKR